MSLLPPSSGDHPGEPVHGAYSPDPDGPTPFQTSPPWWSRTWVKVAAAAAFIVFTSWRAGVFDTRSDVDRGLDAVQTEFIEMGISEDSWDCIERGLREGGYLEGLEDGVDEADSDALQEILLDSSRGLDEADPALVSLLEGFNRFMLDPSDGCLSAQELQLVLAAPIEGAPMNVGSDADLDLLHSGCLAGSLADCDMLYITSPPQSEYEGVALECGGRNEPLDPFRTHCMALHNDYSEGDRMASDCEVGYFPACDLLYYISLPGSELEARGLTCGGRRSENPSVNCWMQFGHGSRP